MKLNNEYRFEVKKKRPEEIYEKVTEYFKGKTLLNYARSKSLMRIQEKITIRSLELLDLKKKEGLILDAGCGPGFTSIYLKEIGYNVVALDLISEFLSFYNIRELNPLAADISFMPFQPNIFDAIISISALQWIYRELKNETMEYKLINLATCINNILKSNSKAIFQFYPKNNLIMEAIGKIFTKHTDLIGDFVIDNPDNAKKRRIFLVLKKRE
ncbi:MAG: class I SAM-dependent methyltransferase [Promethearchaeota archaeon]